jgi:hypothetical protein
MFFVTVAAAEYHAAGVKLPLGTQAAALVRLA